MRPRIAAALSLALALAPALIGPSAPTSAAVADAGVRAPQGSPPVLRIPASAGPAVTPEANSAQAAATVSAFIHHYNVCGNNRNACTATQSQNALQLLLDWWDRDRPWFISVNEMCKAGFERVARAHPGVGATMVFTKLSTPNCPPAADGGTEFGNAIFYPGGVRTTGQAWYLSNPGKDCRVDECRAMLCEKLNTFAGKMQMCTAHITNEGMDLRVQQAAEYIWNARAYNDADRRLVMAGDFNLEQPQLPGAYADDVNLVISLTIHTRNGLTKKIDHIFVQRVGSYTWRSASCPTNASDHCHTTGVWHIPV